LFIAITIFHILPHVWTNFFSLIFIVLPEFRGDFVSASVKQVSDEANTSQNLFANML